MSVSDEQLARIFLRHSRERYAKIGESGNTLAHYTDAENAIRIIQNDRITLRNALLMNDFSEIEHGQRCLSAAWGSQHGGGSPTNRTGRLAVLMEPLFPGLLEEIEERILSATHLRRSATYVFSLTEHSDADDGELGRLSMWRAYGGETAVALVVDRSILDQNGTHPYAFLSPVEYKSPDEFVPVFSEFVSGMEDSKDLLYSAPRDQIFRFLAFALEAAMLSLKHPGFAEEREWRLICSSAVANPIGSNTDTISIGGVPQRVVYYRPQYPATTEPTSRSISSIVDKIIVGPTATPFVIRDALIETLRAANASRPEERVVASTIPLRR